MKRLLLFISFIIITLTTYSQNNYGKHFAAGFAIGGGMSMLPQFKPNKALWISPTVAFFAGLSKEVSDYSSGYRFDKKDILYTVIGGAVAGVITRQVKMGIEKRKANKKKITAL